MASERPDDGTEDCDERCTGTESCECDECLYPDDDEVACCQCGDVHLFTDCDGNPLRDYEDDDDRPF